MYRFGSVKDETDFNQEEIEPGEKYSLKIKIDGDKPNWNFPVGEMFELENGIHLKYKGTQMMKRNTEKHTDLFEVTLNGKSLNDVHGKLFFKPKDKESYLKEKLSKLNPLFASYVSIGTTLMHLATDDLKFQMTVNTKKLTNENKPKFDLPTMINLDKGLSLLIQ